MSAIFSTSMSAKAAGKVRDARRARDGTAPEGSARARDARDGGGFESRARDVRAVSWASSMGETARG